MKLDFEEDLVALSVLRTLQHTGVKLSDKILEETPRRVARALKEQLAGYEVDVPSLFKTFEEKYVGLVVVDNINFSALCEHHLLPFSGIAHVGYFANDGKVLGASKLSRIVEAFSRRLTLQERIAEDIVGAFKDHLTPDVAVYLRAQHQCMVCRGVKQSRASMSVCRMHGQFTDSAAMQSEFYNLIHQSVLPSV